MYRPDNSVNKVIATLIFLLVALVFVVVGYELHKKNCYEKAGIIKKNVVEYNYIRNRCVIKFNESLIDINKKTKERND